MKEQQKKVFRLTLSQFVATLILIFTLSLSIIVFSVVNLHSSHEIAVGDVIRQNTLNHWEVSQSNVTPPTSFSEDQPLSDSVLPSIIDDKESQITSVIEDLTSSDEEEEPDTKKEKKDENDEGDSAVAASEDSSHVNMESDSNSCSEGIGSEHVIEVIDGDESEKEGEDTGSTTSNDSEEDRESEGEAIPTIAIESPVQTEIVYELSEKPHDNDDVIGDSISDNHQIEDQQSTQASNKEEVELKPGIISEEEVKEEGEAVTVTNSVSERTNTDDGAIIEQEKDEKPSLLPHSLTEDFKEETEQNQVTPQPSQDTANTPTNNTTTIANTTTATITIPTTATTTPTHDAVKISPVSGNETAREGENHPAMTADITSAQPTENENITTTNTTTPTTTTTTPTTTTSPNTPSSSAASEMERRKVEAKLKIVYSYLARQEYDKALQQLQVILKKYDQQHQPATSSSSKARRGSAATPPLPTDVAVELLYLRAQLYHSHLQQSDLALRDYVSIFQRHTTENTTVNHYLLTSLQHLLDTQRHQEALELFQHLLPILHIHTSATTLQTYLHLLVHTAHYEKCVTLLGEVEANQTSSQLLSESVLLTYYIDCYSHLNDTSAKEKVEYYTLLQLEHNLTTPETVGEMYSRQRQYMKAIEYYQRALSPSSSNLLEIDRQLQTLPPSTSEDSEEVEHGSGRRRGRGKLFSAVSSSKSKRQTLQRERRVAEHQVGMLYRAMAMNHYLHLLAQLNTSSSLSSSEEMAENNATLLHHLTTTLEYVQEAMKCGVYDKEVRLFLSQYDALHRRVTGNDGSDRSDVIAPPQAIDNGSVAVTTTTTTDETDSVAGSEVVRRGALRRSYYPRFNYTSELPDELYLAAKYFPRRRWIVDAPVTASDSSSSSSSPSARSSGGGLMMNASSKLIDQIFQQHSSDSYEGDDADSGSAMGGSSFEKRFESEKRKQGYEEEE